MEIDKTTCWYNNTTTPSEMIRGAKGELWPVLENSDHFPVLHDLMMSSANSSSMILDIGCGAAELSRVYKMGFYTGVDLPHIIDNVARKMHPQNNYISFDVYDLSSDDSFISEYDVIVMNAFIDVLEKPVLALERILSKAKGKVILHRQTWHDDKPTHLSKHSSYGGVSYQSIINRMEAVDLFNKNGFKIKREHVINYDKQLGYSTSILLEKNNEVR